MGWRGLESTLCLRTFCVVLAVCALIFKSESFSLIYYSSCYNYQVQMPLLDLP